ncbi:ThuA domain-containing protein [Mycetocola zhujimingii]|nr:ThuA domain-containing protein [Mycetocola zhujimingii]
MKSLKSILSTGTAIAATAVLSAGLVFAGTAAADSRGHGHGNGNGNKPTTADSIYLDEIKDYGVCRGTDAACYNEWGNGWKEGEPKRILIWSRTAGPRHAHLGTPLGPGLNPPLNADNVAQASLKAWAAERGIQADYTEDLASFSRLNSYQAVVFLGSNRDTLDDPAQTNLMQYVRGGGGFVGVHNAFGAEYHWEWYEGLLGGANFYDHAPNRPGTIETINKKDVSTNFMPRKWGFTDEWYNLVPYPSYVNVLLEVDPKTSLNGRATGHPGHGEQHAVSWCQYYDGGKSWLTTLGHDVAVWTDAPIAGDDLFKEHLMSGLESAMGIKPFCAV